MPQPDDMRDEALKRLDQRLDAIDARRVRPVSVLGGTEGAGEGYRMVAGLIGGVLGGLGFGWLFDHFIPLIVPGAHTSPFGLIGGLLIGIGVSIVGVVTSAVRMSAKAAATGPVPPPAPQDEDDEA
jgi:ATP synthase protein I